MEVTEMISNTMLTLWCGGTFVYLVYEYGFQLFVPVAFIVLLFFWDYLFYFVKQNTVVVVDPVLSD